jgi:hypothetical protein
LGVQVLLLLLLLLLLLHLEIKPRASHLLDKCFELHPPVLLGGNY